MCALYVHVCWCFCFWINIHVITKVFLVYVHVYSIYLCPVYIILEQKRENGGTFSYSNECKWNKWKWLNYIKSKQTNQIGGRKRRKSQQLFVKKKTNFSKLSTLYIFLYFLLNFTKFNRTIMKRLEVHTLG